MLKLKALFQRGSHSNLYLFIYLPLQPLGRQALAQGRAEKIFQIHNLVFGAQGGGLCLLTNIDDGEHRWRREHAIFSGRVNKHFNLSGFFPNGSTSACLYVYRYAYIFLWYLFGRSGSFTMPSPLRLLFCVAFGNHSLDLVSLLPDLRSYLWMIIKVRFV